jgi:hypothetical protein
LEQWLADGWKRLLEHDLKQAVESLRAKPQAAS